MKDKNIHIKSTGYKVPENYFEDFDSRLFNKLDSKFNLPQGMEAGFKVPDTYFERLDKNIISKIKEEPQVISIFNWKLFSVISAAAASLILCAAIYFNTNKQDEFSIELVENYFVLQDLDTYELAQLLSETEFISDDFNIIETTYNEDHLETYLLEQTDIEEILE